MGDRDPNDPEFRCKHCFIEKDGKTIYVPLKQSSETAAQAQGKFQWKKDFIQLTAPIMEHVQMLELLLKKEKDNLVREALDKNGLASLLSLLSSLSSPHTRFSRVTYCKML